MKVYKKIRQGFGNWRRMKTDYLILFDRNLDKHERLEPEKENSKVKNWYWLFIREELEILDVEDLCI